MGATFAYFSLTSSVAGSSTTNITGQTGTQEKLPTITMTGDKTLVLNVSDAQMSQNTEAYGKYYAVVSSTGNEPSLKNSVQNHEIAEVKVKDGQEGYTYTCTANFKIATSGDLFQAEGLTAGDGALVITGEANNVLIGAETTKSFDLLSLKDKADGGSEETFTVTFKNLSTANLETGLKLKADLYVENRDAKQNYLSNKKLTVSIKNADFTCDTDVKAG